MMQILIQGATRTIIGTFGFVLTLLVLPAVHDSAWSQSAMLEPPSNHYFISQGSWGQNYPDQWGLKRIGFDASPDSAWRLVKANAQPVIVAVRRHWA